MNSSSGYFSGCRACLVGLALGAGVAHAQTLTGNLAGSVRTAKGDPIPAAKVVLTTQQGNRTCVVNARGHFLFPQMIPGPVIMTVMAEGFVAYRGHARIGLDLTARADVILATTGENPEEAETSSLTYDSGNADKGEGLDLDGRDPHAGLNLPMALVDHLPIPERDMDRVSTLAPGVVTDAAGNNAIRGAQQQQTVYLLDGLNFTDPLSGGLGVKVNDDFIEEVQVQTGGLSAEYGTSGGIVNAVTRSGTNQWSGTLRADVSDPAWTAYRPGEKALAPLSVQSENRKSGLSALAGFTLFGPIIKDRCFFGVGYQTQTSPLRTLQQNTPYANLPQVTSVPVPTWQNTSTSDPRSLDLKLDLLLFEDHRLYGYYNTSEVVITQDNLGQGSPSQFANAGGLTDYHNGGSSFTLGYQGSLSSDLVLALRYNGISNSSTRDYKTNGGSAITWLDQGSGGQEVNSATYDNLGLLVSPDRRTLTAITADLTWYKDLGIQNHVVKGGIQSSNSERRSQAPPVTEAIFFNGFASGASVTSLPNRLLNSNSLLVYQYNDLSASTASDVAAAFINDQWRISPRFGTALGVRFDQTTVSWNQSGSSTTARTRDLSPRVALLFDFNGNGKDLLQVSAGQYVGGISQGTLAQVSTLEYPLHADYPYTSPGTSVVGSQSTQQILQHFATSPYFNTSPDLAKLIPNAKLKPERMREWAAQYKRRDLFGADWSLNYNHRTWDRVISDSFNNTNGDVSLINDPTIQRTYDGLEGQWTRRTGPWDLGFNATLSHLSGNYDGNEGSLAFQRSISLLDGPFMEYRNLYQGTVSAPSYAPGLPAPTNATVAPTGLLSGNRAIQTVLYAVYTWKVTWGEGHCSALFHTTSATPYTPYLWVEFPQPITTNWYKSGQPTATGYPDMASRGSLNLPASYTLDCRAGWEVKRGGGLVYFLLINIKNTLNHQVLAQVDALRGTYAPSLTGSNSSSYTPNPNFGKAPLLPGSTTRNDPWAFTLPRTLTFATGIRF